MKDNLRGLLQIIASNNIADNLRLRMQQATLRVMTSDIGQGGNAYI